MTQMGIEYLKARNQSDANAEIRRSNLANEAIKRTGLAEDARFHDMQIQASLDNAATAAAASRYSANASYAASKYHSDSSAAASKYAADQGLKKGTAAGAYEAGGGGFTGGLNVLGYLWETLI